MIFLAITMCCIVQIEIPNAPFPGEPPVILLSPKPILSAGDFEKKWISMDKTYVELWCCHI